MNPGFDEVNGTPRTPLHLPFRFFFSSGPSSPVLSICSMEVIRITRFAKQVFTRLYHARKITAFLYSALNSKHGNFRHLSFDMVLGTQLSST